ncbi:MAG: glycosyltransferase family 4 protein [Treponema sp.]
MTDNEKYVQEQYSKAVGIINKNLQKKNFEKALAGISVCANLMYMWNQQYTDDFLEDAVAVVAQNTFNNQLDNICIRQDTVLFYDGFGLDTRGLALIYLKALASSSKKIIYLTTSRGKNHQRQIDAVLEKSHYAKKIYFSHNAKYLAKIKILQKCFIEYSPSSAFFYTQPDDSAGAAAFMQVAKKIRRFQINLTDHAFWLGRNAFDYCIEFRDYGASISLSYRKIDKEKIVKLPYYPYANCQIEFQGFPFNPKGKKIIFSGGSLYKTIDENKTYYKIVASILKENVDVVFLYAGYGDDSYLQELKTAFSSRVFHIEERKDLFQLMQHVTLYLNTYPMIGGLMTQYAAMANKLPITLKHNDDGSGILINQESRNYEYNSPEELINDVNRLLSDEKYLHERENLLNGSVITEEKFNANVLALLKENKTEYNNIKFFDIDTTDFRNDYKERFDKKSFVYCTASKKNLCLLPDYPCSYVTKIYGGGGYYYSEDLQVLQKNFYDVSILVACFNPDVKKLLLTIASALIQKKIDIQIIVCDDGSKNFPLEELFCFFEKYDFNDYVICLANKNKGTVQNIINGIDECEGRFLKLISPGDYLYKENCLYDWCKFVKDLNLDFSIGRAVYYTYGKNGIESVKHNKSHPQTTRNYYNNQWYWNYLIFDDIALGASILCKTDVTRKYLSIIYNKIHFAEDNIYRIMAADKLKMSCFNNDCILYEYGTGISTSGNDFWSKILKEDWQATDKIILERINPYGYFESVLYRVLTQKKTCMKVRILQKILTPGFMINYLKNKFQPTYTSTNLDSYYVQKLLAFCD